MSRVARLLLAAVAALLVAAAAATPAAPVHPNLLGMLAASDLVVAAAG